MEDLARELHCFLRGSAAGITVKKCDVELDTGYEKLMVKQNVCYIVAGLLFNDEGEVLMVQEAKPSCYKKWYLPAGRMEPNETIVDAAKREVLEEAGLNFEPDSMISVEECGGRWVRFTLAGKVLGGKLKTTQEADEESLQAMWWNRNDDISLRCGDILPLIDMGLEKQTSNTRTFKLLPAIQPHRLLFLRVMVAYLNEENCHVLLYNDKSHNTTENGASSTSASLRLPTTRIHPEDVSFRMAVKNLCLQALDMESMPSADMVIAGVLGVEHSGGSSAGLDGLGVNILVSLRGDGSNNPPTSKEDFTWLSVGDIVSADATTLIRDACANASGSLVPLRSLRAKKESASVL